MNYQELLTLDKALIQAAAGCGKTYTIVESLRHITEGRALILTHTHAGVKSIKDKANLLGIKPNVYYVTTIHSFAKQYLQAFYVKEDIPKEEDSSYYDFILNKSKDIFSTSIVQDVIEASYKYIFVDEYQDCTKNQHEIIMLISRHLKTYLFGDPMQGIYNFNGRDLLVNWETDIPKEFKKIYLDKPYRWINNNEGLGRDIKKIRSKLEKRENININDYMNIEYIQDPRNFRAIHKIYNILSQNEKVLLIDANSYMLNSRVKFASTYNMRFQVMEAITEKEFYKIARLLDNYERDYDTINIKTVFTTLFKSSINKYFSNNFILKRNISTSPNEIVKKFSNLYYNFQNEYTKNALLQVLKTIIQLPEIKLYRHELFHDLCNTISEAASNNTTIYQAMCSIRNNKSILGYKPPNKCIGTTLITKGLEFDIVVLLNADKFKDPKNFYVAISRACKKLYIVSPTQILHPYS